MMYEMEGSEIERSISFDLQKLFCEFDYVRQSNDWVRFSSITCKFDLKKDSISFELTRRVINRLKNTMLHF